MQFSTTPTLEGQTIVEYCGVVTGEAILGANIFRDFFAGIRDIVGGRSGAYEKELRKAREIAFEELFFARNVTTALTVGAARGVSLAACAEYTDRLYEYTPMQVKQAVVGYGKAEKHQVMDMTRRLLRLDRMPRPDDAADAIAIALCHARSSTSQLARLMGGKP